MGECVPLEAGRVGLDTRVGIGSVVWASEVVPSSPLRPALLGSPFREATGAVLGVDGEGGGVEEGGEYAAAQAESVRVLAASPMWKNWAGVRCWEGPMKKGAWGKPSPAAIRDRNTTEGSILGQRRLSFLGSRSKMTFHSLANRQIE